MKNFRGVSGDFLCRLTEFGAALVAEHHVVRNGVAAVRANLAGRCFGCRSGSRSLKLRTALVTEHHIRSYGVAAIRANLAGGCGALTEEAVRLRGNVRRRRRTKKRLRNGLPYC